MRPSMRCECMYCLRINIRALVLMQNFLGLRDLDRVAKSAIALEFWIYSIAFLSTYV